MAVLQRGQRCTLALAAVAIFMIQSIEGQTVPVTTSQGLQVTSNSTTGLHSNSNSTNAPQNSNSTKALQNFNSTTAIPNFNSTTALPNFNSTTAIPSFNSTTRPQVEAQYANVSLILRLNQTYGLVQTNQTYSNILAKQVEHYLSVIYGNWASLVRNVSVTEFTPSESGLTMAVVTVTYFYYGEEDSTEPRMLYYIGDILNEVLVVSGGDIFLGSNSATTQVLSPLYFVFEDEEQFLAVPILNKCSVYDGLRLCQNGGSCSVNEGGNNGPHPVCNCAVGFYGEFCEALIQMDGLSPGLSQYYEAGRTLNASFVINVTWDLQFTNHSSIKFLNLTTTLNYQLNMAFAIGNQTLFKPVSNVTLSKEQNVTRVNFLVSTYKAWSSWSGPQSAVQTSLIEAKMLSIIANFLQTSAQSKLNSGFQVLSGLRFDFSDQMGWFANGATNGTAVNKPPSAPFNITDVCSYINAMSPPVCQNGGMCVSFGQWPTCRCTEKFDGPDCSQDRFPDANIQYVGIPLNLNYTSDLANTRTDLYQTLTRNITAWASNAFYGEWFIDVRSIRVLNYTDRNSKTVAILALPIVTSSDSNFPPYGWVAVMMSEEYSRTSWNISHVLVGNDSFTVSKQGHALVQGLTHSEIIEVNDVCGVYQQLGVCQNGANCSDEGFFPSCQCPDNYVGPTCSIERDFVDIQVTLSLPWMDVYSSIDNEDGLKLGIFLTNLLTEEFMNVSLASDVNILKISKSSNSRWTSLEFRVGLTLPNFMQLYDWQLKSQFVDGISRYIHQGIRFQYSGNTVQVFEDSLRVLLNLNGTRTEVEYLDLCSLITAAHVCQNGGVCLTSLDNSFVRCSCPLNFYGDDCSSNFTFSNTDSVTLRISFDLPWKSVYNNASSPETELVSNAIQSLVTRILLRYYYRYSSEQLWSDFIGISESSHGNVTAEIYVRFTANYYDFQQPNYQWKNYVIIGDVLAQSFQPNATTRLYIHGMEYKLTGDLVMTVNSTNSGEIQIPYTGPCSIYEALDICENGGVCDNSMAMGAWCRCPRNFVGELCSYPAADMTIRVTLNLTWNDDYSNNRSDAFHAIAFNLSLAMKATYFDYSDSFRLTVLRFSKISSNLTTVEVSLAFQTYVNRTLLDVQQDILGRFVTMIKSTNGSFSANDLIYRLNSAPVVLIVTRNITTEFILDDQCSLYDFFKVCTNGGECIVNYNDLAVCSCVGDFVGPTCRNSSRNFETGNMTLAVTLNITWSDLYLDLNANITKAVVTEITRKLRSAFIGFDTILAVQVTSLRKSANQTTIVEFGIIYEISWENKLSLQAYEKAEGIIKHLIYVAYGAGIYDMIDHLRIIQISGNVIQVDVRNILNDSCYLINTLGVCENGGRCVYLGSNILPRCRCEDGFTGDMCDVPITCRTNTITLKLTYNLPWEDSFSVLSMSDPTSLVYTITLYLESTIGQFSFRSVYLNITSIRKSEYNTTVVEFQSTYCADSFAYGTNEVYLIYIFASTLNGSSYFAWNGRYYNLQRSLEIILSDDTDISYDSACSVYNAYGMCKNGGRCYVYYGYYPLCLCTAQYSGYYCDKEKLTFDECLESALECVPGDLRDPRLDDCSYLSSGRTGSCLASVLPTCLSDPFNVASYSDLGVVTNLTEVKVNRMSSKCILKYCFNALESCFGDTLLNAYNSGDWSLLCQDWNQHPASTLATCLERASQTCYAAVHDTTIIDIYVGILAGVCQPDKHLQTCNVESIKCYPYAAIDVTTRDFDAMCLNESAVESCVLHTMNSSICDGADKTAMYGALRINKDACDVNTRCSNSMSACFDAYLTSSVPTKLIPDLICSSYDLVLACVNNSVCPSAYYQGLEQYLHTVCDGTLCQTGLQRCYDTFGDISGEIEQYMAGTDQHSRSWCNVTSLMRECLEPYESVCQSSGNDTMLAFYNSLDLFCSSSLDSENSCYLRALKCLSNDSMSGSIQELLQLQLTPNSPYCTDVAEKTSCLSSALSTCQTNSSIFGPVINHISSVLQASCSDACTSVKKTECLDSLNYYLVQRWSDPSDASQICGVFSNKSSCFDIQAKQCSPTSQGDNTLGVSIVTSVVHSIDVGCADDLKDYHGVQETCQVTSISSCLIKFVNLVSMTVNQAEVDTSTICSGWMEAVTCLSDTSVNCSGFVNASVSRIVASVDRVVSSICSQTECHLTEAVQCVDNLIDMSNRIAQYQRPWQYTDGCDHDEGKDSCVQDDEYCRVVPGTQPLSTPAPTTTLKPEEGSKDKNPTTTLKPEGGSKDKIPTTTVAPDANNTDPNLPDPSEPQMDCQHFDIKWGIFCDEIVSSYACVVNKTSNCSSVISSDLLRSMQNKFHSYYQACSANSNIKCNVEESMECIRGVVETGFQMSTNQGSDGDKALVCRTLNRLTSCIWDNLIQCTPHVYNIFLPVVNSFSETMQCKIDDVMECPDMCTLDYSPVCGSDGITYSNDCQLTSQACRSGTNLVVAHIGSCTLNDTSSPSTRSPPTPPPCGMDSAEECIANFTGILLRETLTVEPNLASICQMWEQARQCVVRSIGAFTNKLECRNAMEELDAFQSGIQERMDWICSGPSCHLRSAYVCIDELEYIGFMANRSWSMQEQKHSNKWKKQYCGYAANTLKCIERSTLTCDGQLVSKAYSKFYDVQSSINCFSRCSSSPCLNGGICYGPTSTSYKCRCPAGFSGLNCETVLCDEEDIRTCMRRPMDFNNLTQLCSNANVTSSCLTQTLQYCSNGTKTVILEIEETFGSYLKPVCDDQKLCDVSRLHTCFGRDMTWQNSSLNQDSNLFCRMSNLTCIHEVLSGCDKILGFVNEVMSYLCDNDVNSCSIKTSLSCIFNLEYNLWLLNQSSPLSLANSKILQQIFSNFTKDDWSGVFQLEKFFEGDNRTKYGHEQDVDTDVCWRIQEQIDCSFHSVMTCNSNKMNLVNETVHQLLLASDVDRKCAQPCMENRCQNEGECVPNRYGYSCRCLPGYSGQHCEIGAVCNMTRAVECLNHAGQQMMGVGDWHSKTCSNISVLYECLSVHMMPCKDTDFAVFKLLSVYMDAVTEVCQSNVTTSTCEMDNVLVCNFALVSGVYFSTPPSSSSDICRFVTSAHQCYKDISFECGNVTELTIDSIQKSWWAVEELCPKSNCSVMNAAQCIGVLFERILEENSPDGTCSAEEFGDDLCRNSTCELAWYAEACVRSNVESCETGIKDEVLGFLERMNTATNVTNRCPNPCMTMPCRNGGSCRQTSADSYVCECPQNLTGKYCEIDVGCDMTAVRMCMVQAKDVIIDGLLDVCDVPQVNCSLIDSLLDCLQNNTASCDDDTQSRVDVLAYTLTKLRVFCSNQSAPILPPAGQSCYSCVNADTNAECNEGSKEICHDNQVCQTVVDTKKRTQLKKGCKERHACKAGPQGGSGKCVFCCTGPDCDLDPVSKFPRECGAEYTTFNQTLNRRKRSLTDCPPQPFTCVVSDIKECVFSFVDTVVVEYTETSGADYAALCSAWNQSSTCVTSRSITCTGPFRASINATLTWMEQSTGHQCSRPVCFPDASLACLTNVNDEIEAFKHRPSIPEGEHTEFCRLVQKDMQCVYDNIQECDNANVTKFIWSSLNSTINDIDDLCTFPCMSNPCQHDGKCEEVSYKEYSCQCTKEYTGRNCELINIRYPYENDTSLDCVHSGRVGVFDIIRMDRDMAVFGRSEAFFYISENGYISFDDQSLIVNFNKFCSKSHTFLAPLYAKQDCSCDGSAIYYHTYYNNSFVSVRDQEVIVRARNDVIRYAKLPKFVVSSVVVVTWENMKPYPCHIYQYAANLQGSTYQLVMVSDSRSTYAMFNYFSVDVRYQLPAVAMGYTDVDGRCLSNSASGTSAMDHLERVNSTTGELGRWFFTLYDNMTQHVPTAEESCLAWTASTIDLSSLDLDSCPCSGLKASIDPRYQLISIDWNRYCFASNRILKSNGRDKRIGPDAQFNQVCCFDPFSNDSLITTPPYAGHSQLVSGSSTSDLQAYQWCCMNSTRYCNLFYSLRPPGTCNRYTAPIQALLWGDPHFMTLDGLSYTFNGIGEYTMLATTDGVFRLQTRTAQASNVRNQVFQASAFVAFVAEERGAARVQVELTDDKQGLIAYINGVNAGSSVNKIVNHTNINIASTSANVTFPSGYVISIRIIAGMMAIQNTVPTSAWGRTRGLLGNYNGDPSDDLMTPDGKVLSISSNSSDIFYKFGLKWQILANESMFVYPSGRTAADFINAGFIPVFDPPCYTDQDRLLGVQTCGDNKDCYFDYCVTKDTYVAQGTKEIEATFLNNKQMLMNSAPVLTIADLPLNSLNQYVINATVGHDISFRLTATSSQTSQVNILMVGNVSTEPSVSFNSTTGLFRWTPASLNPVDISFVAVDSVGGVSAKLQVIVTLCSGCSGNGNCNFASFSSSGNGTTFRFADCSCNVGWTGSNCSAVYNGCASNPCTNTAACHTLTPAQQVATNTGYTCTACPPGYGTDQCVDIDECQTQTSNCSQICTNTIGGYFCSCRFGYRQSGSHDCIDIDECLEMTDNCSQTCANTPGSYVCGCFNGFQLNDKNACVPITSCDSSNQCSFACTVFNQKQTCVCPPGYALNADGRTCTDIDECSNLQFNKCSSKDLCINSIGSYTCGCPIGSMISADLRTCQECPDGYYGLDCKMRCQCSSTVQKCDKIQGCSVCQAGWANPPNCKTNINECTDGTAVCGPNSSCQDVQGTYLCPCNVGYEKNPGGVCIDVNECQANNMCSQNCNNTIGSYTCSCRTGYRLTDNYHCIDIDECAEQSNVCTQTCTNTLGSYQCSCRGGYQLVDGFYCAPDKQIARLTLKLVKDWDNSYVDMSTPGAISMKKSLETQLKVAFSSVTSFRQVFVTSFFQGSVGFNIVVVSDTPLTTANQSSIATALLSYLDIVNWRMTVNDLAYQVAGRPTISIDNQLVDMVDPCSVYSAFQLCSNDGQCAVENNLPTCQCSKYFSGSFCDVYNSSSYSNYIGLAVGLSVLGFVILAVALGVVIYCCKTRRGSRSKYEETSSEMSESAALHAYDNPATRIHQWWPSPAKSVGSATA